MRCLNFWDNKNFWGAKSGPPSPATSVKTNKSQKLSVDIEMYGGKDYQNLKNHLLKD